MRSNLALKPVSRLPRLRERSDGLWEFHGAQTIEEHAAEFVRVDTGMDSSRWKAAAIAASVETKYGERTLERLAPLVGHKLRYVRKLARTYRVTVEKGLYRVNCPQLTFSHYVEASRCRNPEKALAVAVRQRMSSDKLSLWVSQHNSKGFRPHVVQAQRELDFHVFLEHVEQVIEDDFMGPRCPNVQWARRMFGPVLEEIREENKRLYLTEDSGRIMAAVNGGALTIQDIKLATGLPLRDVQKAVDRMLTEGWQLVASGDGHNSRRAKTLQRA